MDFQSREFPHRAADGRSGGPGKAVSSWLLWSEQNVVDVRAYHEILDDPETPPEKREATATLLDEILQSAPDFDANIELCVLAWNDLNSCRGIGMSAGPIPFTAFEIWCRFHDLDYAIALHVWAVIRHLDREYFEREQSKRNLERQQQRR